MPEKQTKRERKELARKARLEQQRRAARRRQIRRIQSIALVVLVGLGIWGIVWFSGRGGRALEGDLVARAEAAGCNSLQKLDDEGHQHVDPGQTVDYKTNPPTSGNHYPSWENTGVHEQPIQNELQVHNLEHGHVGIQYKPDAVSEEVLQALEDVTNDNDEWVFMAPRTDEGFDSAIAFTAWQRLLTCGEDMEDDPEAIKEVAETFVSLHRDKSPWESVRGQPR